MGGELSHQAVIERYLPLIEAGSVEFLQSAVSAIVDAKRNGQKVVVATGNGPNLHEGVTTLIAELMAKGLIDGVLTSSAVIAHEMAGTLDKVKRLDGLQLGSNFYPRVTPLN
jgi:deoxyhypusine synthase